MVKTLWVTGLSWTLGFGAPRGTIVRIQGIYMYIHMYFYIYIYMCVCVYIVCVYTYTYIIDVYIHGSYTVEAEILQNSRCPESWESRKLGGGGGGRRWCKISPLTLNFKTLLNFKPKALRPKP